MTGEKYVWHDGDVEVAGPPTQMGHPEPSDQQPQGRADPDGSPCQACGKPADDPEIRGLCRTCATRVDTDYEWLRDLAELEHGP